MYEIIRCTGKFDRYAVCYKDLWCSFVVDYFFTKRGAKKFMETLNSQS